MLTPERACLLSRVDFNTVWDIVSTIYQSSIAGGGLNPPLPKRQRLSAEPTDSSVLLNQEKETYMRYLDGIFDSLYLDDGSDYKEGVQPGGMDIIEQWRNLLPQMPRTASVARNILPIMATSIPSERIFSRVKYVGRNRERLTPARMEQLVLSSMNMAHFEKVMPGIGEEEDVPEDAFVGESEGIVDEGAGEAGEAGEY